MAGEKYFVVSTPCLKGLSLFEFRDYTNNSFCVVSNTQYSVTSDQYHVAMH